MGSDKSGFTLIEVLVALAILGILFIGMSSIATSQVRNFDYLQDRLAAAQLAANQMTLFSIQGKPLTPAFSQGEEEIAGRRLPWRRNISTDPQTAAVTVEIIVGDSESPLYVSSWVVQRYIN